MRQFPYRIALLLAIVFSTGSAGAAPITFPLDNTKHDLSSAGTGTYKAKIDSAGGTTEKCIFCHTPHSANSEAPLWNRKSYVQSYGTYTSDVLAALGYWAAENPNSGEPHSKTRICLSCHDGTIALGSVVNMPNNMSVTEIQMSGNPKIQPSAAGYIGIQLQDDHPVAIKYGTTPGDPELISGTLSAGVRLYKAVGGKAIMENADGNYVECTSCHEPHDNKFGNFLVATNTGSALCKQCHTKTGFESTSIHVQAVVGDSYSPPDGKGGSLSTNTRMGTVQCMLCHFPHKAGITDTSLLPAASPNLSGNPKAGYYLLAFQEELTCFNNTNRWGQNNIAACHGSSASAYPNRDIQTVENNNTAPGNRHWTQNPGTVGRHEASEGRAQGWLNGTNLHVECADCHNAHTAGGTNHISPVDPLKVLTSSSPLYGTGGVSKPTTPRNWFGGTGSGYTYREPLGVLNTANTSVIYEYEICFKCHTDWAWGASASNAPTSPSLGLPMTDQAMEFNTAKASFHPVLGGNGKNGQGTMTGSWNAASSTQTMYCSDCHTKDTGTRPLGPHGAGNKFILSYPHDDTQTARGTYQAGGDLCFTCHDSSTYLTGAGVGTGFKTNLGTNLHTRHYADSTNFPPSNFGYKCVNCHIRIPHGWDARKAMVIIAGDAPGSVYQVATGPSITGLVGGVLPGSGLYADGIPNKNANCLTVAGCHQ